MTWKLGFESECPAAAGFLGDDPAGVCANARLVPKSMRVRSREDCLMSIFLFLPNNLSILSAHPRVFANFRGGARSTSATARRTREAGIGDFVRQRSSGAAKENPHASHSTRYPPKLFAALLALGLLTSIAFAIAAGVVSSVARAAPPPQCPTGTILNVQTHACVPVKPPTAAAPAASTPVLRPPLQPSTPL